MLEDISVYFGEIITLLESDESSHEWQHYRLKTRIVEERFSIFISRVKKLLDYANLDQEKIKDAYKKGDFDFLENYNTGVKSHVYQCFESAEDFRLVYEETNRMIGRYRDRRLKVHRLKMITRVTAVAIVVSAVIAMPTAGYTIPMIIAIGGTLSGLIGNHFLEQRERKFRAEVNDVLPHITDIMAKVDTLRAHVKEVLTDASSMLENISNFELFSQELTTLMDEVDKAQKLINKTNS